MTSSQLMNAVLSMDSYNRTYSPGVVVRTTEIGDYSYLNIALPTNSQTISFSASAYRGNDGSIVISYRGTDDGIADYTNGWEIGAGVPFGPQFMAAFQFYNSVRDYLVEEATSAGLEFDEENITTTGHSLGGGLAALVASMKHVNADTFANMTFESAALNAFEDISSGNSSIAEVARDLIYGSNDIMQPPQLTSNISGYAINGEVLEPLRARQTTNVETIDIGDVDYLTLGPNDRHSIALHTIMMWERDNEATVVGWEPASTYVWNSYSNERIASAAGFGSSVTGTNDVLFNMQVALAYSVVDEGSKPFGDTGVIAFFNDARDLGVAITLENSAFLNEDIKQGIADLTVQYAGLLATNAILGTTSVAAGGILTSHNAGDTLSIDFREETWAVGPNTTTPYEKTVLISNIVSTQISIPELNDGLAWYQTNANNVTHSGVDLIGSVTIDIVGANTVIPALDVDIGQLDLIAVNKSVDATVRGISDDFLLGTSDANTLIGGEGTDLIFGVEGDDVLIGGAGISFISGGGGNDLITAINHASISVGTGDDVVWLGNNNNGSRVITLEDGDNSDSLIYNGYKLTGGTWTIFEEEYVNVYWDENRDSIEYTWSYLVAGQIDSIGAIYQYISDNTLEVYLPDHTIVYINNFENGDFGINASQRQVWEVVADPESPRLEFLNDGQILMSDGSYYYTNDGELPSISEYDNYIGAYIGADSNPASIYSYTNPGYISQPGSIDGFI